jgi:hypothetical protein
MAKLATLVDINTAKAEVLNAHFKCNAQIAAD